MGYRRFLETSCDYLCTALTDLLQICGYSREKAGFSLPYKVYGAESAFLILISDLFEPVGPPLTIQCHKWSVVSHNSAILMGHGAFQTCGDSNGG